MNKYILISIFTLLTASTAFGSDASDLPQSCLGFPAGAHFTCEYSPLLGDSSIIEVNIPDGHGCNQAPYSGSIILNDEVFIVYSPSVSTHISLHTSQAETRVTFLKDPNDSETVTLSCTDQIDY